MRTRPLSLPVVLLFFAALLCCALPAGAGEQIKPADANGASRPDIGALARQLNSQRVDRSLMSQGNLLIFVSFSMPELSLKELADQAQRTGAILVLRGMHENSMQKTMDRAREINAGKKVSWQIDPRLYEAFNVSVVPMFVMLKPHALAMTCNQTACRAPQDWAAVTGNVSLAYALETLATGDASLAAQASFFRSKLGESP